MIVGRREFMTLLGGAAATWPLAARGQQPGLPLVGFLGGSEPDPNRIAPFIAGLAEMGYTVRQDVLLE